MNEVQLVGWVLNDPRVREKDGKLISEIIVSVPYGKKDNRQSDFVPCIGFNRTAELIRDYVGKRSKVGITGKVSVGRYETKKGNVKYTMQVLVKTIEFLGQPSFAESSDEGDKTSKPAKSKGKASKPKKANTETVPESVDGAEDVRVSELTDDPEVFGFDVDEEDIPGLELPF